MGALLAADVFTAVGLTRADAANVGDGARARQDRRDDPPARGRRPPGVPRLARWTPSHSKRPVTSASAGRRATEGPRSISTTSPALVVALLQRRARRSGAGPAVRSAQATAGPAGRKGRLMRATRWSAQHRPGRERRDRDARATAICGSADTATCASATLGEIVEVGKRTRHEPFAGENARSHADNTDAAGGYQFADVGRAARSPRQVPRGRGRGAARGDVVAVWRARGVARDQLGAERAIDRFAGHKAIRNRLRAGRRRVLKAGAHRVRRAARAGRASPARLERAPARAPPSCAVATPGPGVGARSIADEQGADTARRRIENARSGSRSARRRARDDGATHGPGRCRAWASWMAMASRMHTAALRALGLDAEWSYQHL